MLMDPRCIAGSMIGDLSLRKNGLFAPTEYMHSVRIQAGASQSFVISIWPGKHKRACI